MKLGKENPNYKHGRYIKNNCKTCNKPIDPRSTFCHKCRPNRGHPLSLEVKKKIGLASKSKFTNEYKEKHYRSKFRNTKHRAINGYILVKNYDHPNRDSHNNILEHVLIMSQSLRRPLIKGEVIHHINFDRADNNILNLYLYKNRSEHIHKAQGSLFSLVKELLRRNIISFEDGKYKIRRRSP